MMVIAMEILPQLQCPGGKCFRRLPDITISPANDFDTGTAERIDRSAADAAAYQDIHLLQRQ